MGIKIIAENRKAGFNYRFLEKLEAGLVLQGSEVKSLRDGKANLGDAYALIKNGEAYLLNCHISPYAPAAGLNHEPLRTRKLLLHKREVDKLLGKLQEKGLTLIPTKLYFKEGRAKVELALAKGKQLFDKRESMKRKESRRTISRAMKHKLR
ncbi:MAG: SsrA-binding protein [Deltaproteobacteria bacterium RIFCSPLOWO2_12_FULL_44_12]|nr:MAG: SsrA-binding protein [Deltaproteobacteria bacterium RIFCSPHIGHO2_01_FULL_43_49]OGQ14570.1 MAG: SsrA-binding protein [Deltaproteobacteria bacterium RIFCSPHIGHO2_02_FULL_44_53]OGQ27956.1 MAG: SsrA-binding protein [Deltaproteobacteria bacterium RIFCSPHIGHO2_12_FULL_44_21]OGQ31168.1 MAG: SsrA-binding protein [Deltaproteobacteria bacterium RIFCSPLOWO2_01_FULL_45_74]OGQ43160.1 MAG: SsrA-binding protein [Deltaproteobacteria bacterium RIFCSPLOWO2_02_FULL_44_34]OGQ69686.1 MAG: SsrA-binding prot